MSAYPCTQSAITNRLKKSMIASLTPFPGYKEWTSEKVSMIWGFTDPVGNSSMLHKTCRTEEL